MLTAQIDLYTELSVNKTLKNTFNSIHCNDRDSNEQLLPSKLLNITNC